MHLKLISLVFFLCQKNFYIFLVKVRLYNAQLTIFMSFW